MGSLNKKSIKKIALKLVLLLWTFAFWGGMSSSMAASRDWVTTLVLLKSMFLDQYFSMVHFSVWWNDFWWGIIWLPVKQIEWDDPVKISVKSGSQDIYCASQVRGFYWNSQRGDSRIWPLDPLTHDWLTGYAGVENYWWLVLSWWWYTTCCWTEECASEMMKLGTFNKSQTDSFGIYGSISHYYSWVSAEPMNLVAWVAYSPVTNRMLTWASARLTCSLQRLNNTYPFGYIYDDYGHMWLVWARVNSWFMEWTAANVDKTRQFHESINNSLNSDHCVNEMFSFDGEDLQYIKRDPENPSSASWVTVDWICAAGEAYPACLQKFLSWWDWTAPASTTVFSLGIKGIVWLTDEVTDLQKEYYENNQLKSTLLLRTDSSISNIINSTARNAERLCRGKWVTAATSFGDVTCVKPNSFGTIYVSASDIAWKTLIVKNANVSLTNNFTANSKAINLFIDGWNLFVNNAAWWTMQKFNSYWYIDASGKAQAYYLKGNFIINGLLLWGGDGTELFTNRMYIHGKLVSYNTLTLPTDKRKETIKSIITSNDYSEYTWVSLMKLFTWTCDVVAGTGSDGTWCRWDASTTNSDAQLIDKAFGLIDVDIPSDLVWN